MKTAGPKPGGPWVTWGHGASLKFYLDLIPDRGGADAPFAISYNQNKDILTMAIEFNRTFGDRSKQGRGAANGNQGDMPKAQFWLNFGYFTDEGTEDERFVSLPVGIPLDTTEKVSTRSSNADFAHFQAARNDLLDQFIELCSDLAPGDAHVIRTEGNLAVQIRRVNDEQVLPAVDESNKYARPKLFAVA